MICVCGNSLILYILYILRAVIFLMTRLRSNLGFDNVCVFVLCVYIMIIVIYLPTIWNKREREKSSSYFFLFFSFVRSSYQISEISPTLSLYTIYIKALVEAIYMVIILYKRNSSFFNFLSLFFDFDFDVSLLFVYCISCHTISIYLSTYIWSWIFKHHG